MAERRPLVVISGEMQELPVGDALVGQIADGDKGDVIVTGGGTGMVLDDGPKYGLPAAMRQGAFFN